MKEYYCPCSYNQRTLKAVEKWRTGQHHALRPKSRETSTQWKSSRFLMASLVTHCTDK